MPMNKLITANFHFSVWLSILGGLLLFNQPNLFFDDPDDMYGPLKTNLLIVVGYFVINQLVLWFAYFSRKKGQQYALLMGLVFVLAAGGMQFYARVNALPLLDWLPFTALYIGASHCLYYWMFSQTEAENAQQPG